MRIIEDVDSVKYDCIMHFDSSVTGKHSQFLDTVGHYFLPLTYVVALKDDDKCYYPLVLKDETKPCYFIELTRGSIHFNGYEFMTILKPYFDLNIEACGENIYLKALDNLLFDIRFKTIRDMFYFESKLDEPLDIIDTEIISWWTKYAAKSTILIQDTCYDVDDVYRFCRVYINGDDEPYIAKVCSVNNFVSYPVATIVFSVIAKESDIKAYNMIDDLEKYSYIAIDMYTHDNDCYGILSHAVALKLGDLGGVHLTAINYNPAKFISTLFNFDDCKIEKFLEFEEDK